MEQPHTVIGLMSGSSLDGLDIAYVVFWKDHLQWKFDIQHTECIAYPSFWRKRLSDAFYAGSSELHDLHLDYGTFIGREVKLFMDKFHICPELIASHGHTVFHKPEEGVTLQIGDGNRIADLTGVMVINDFRSEDVLKGGQGAPLVPVGDKLLFSAYDACINIGGIANVSFDDSFGARLAYDICPANQILDYLAAQEGYAYDPGGALASAGNPDKSLLEKLNQLDYYQRSIPKSLGREWVESDVIPLLQSYKIAVKDLLRTYTEHMAFQIAQSLMTLSDSSDVLITGGGARNNFLIERIKTHTPHRIEVPDPVLIDFKEALVFAFLGLLRWKGITNVYKSVTGAGSDSCAGTIHLP